MQFNQYPFDKNTHIYLWQAQFRNFIIAKFIDNKHFLDKSSLQLFFTALSIIDINVKHIVVFVRSRDLAYSILQSGTM